MEKIEVEFYGCFLPAIVITTVIVQLTLDEDGKHLSFDYATGGAFFRNNYKLSKPVIQPPLPKRVLSAFTEHAIDKILSKDKIPLNSPTISMELGHMYSIKISKGSVTRKYRADDDTIETYPFLRYLASWYNRLNQVDIMDF